MGRFIEEHLFSTPFGSHLVSESELISRGLDNLDSVSHRLTNRVLYRSSIDAVSQGKSTKGLHCHPCLVFMRTNTRCF